MGERPLRVAYVLNWEGGSGSGPFKKVAEQVATWTRLGAEAGVFVFTTEAGAADWKLLPETRRVEIRTRNPAALLRRKGHLLRDALSWAPDVVYHRYTMPYPALISAVRRTPVVVEINTDDVVEYQLLSRPRGRVNRWTRGLVLGRAAGLVFVARELERKPIFSRYRRRSTVIGNGVDLAAHATGTPVPHTGPRLVFIGGAWCPWHGLDKLMWLARRHPDWMIDVIGPFQDVVTDRPPNVVLHNELSSADYRPILANADVGVGSLALYRKGMEEASPLKVREYLASGLPVIIGYLDTDFPDGAPFLLRVPNAEDGVARAEGEIESFVRRWRGLRVPRAEIEHLDATRKELTRLRFLAEVCGRTLGIASDSPVLR